MRLLNELLPGAWVIELDRLADERGFFQKTYLKKTFLDMGISFDCAEEYFSVSQKNVVRGMHFQTPPFDHGKFVYCPAGSVLDVLLDIRSGPSYGKTASIELRATESLALYIPSGIAHGFKALENQTMMIYKTSTAYAPENDAGIAWDSFGFGWGVAVPTVSKRDQEHPSFGQFNTPFKL